MFSMVTMGVQLSWLEHPTHNREVGGSYPPAPTTTYYHTKHIVYISHYTHPTTLKRNHMTKTYAVISKSEPDDRNRVKVRLSTEAGLGNRTTELYMYADKAKHFIVGQEYYKSGLVYVHIPTKEHNV